MINKAWWISQEGDAQTEEAAACGTDIKFLCISYGVGLEAFESRLAGGAGERY